MKKKVKKKESCSFLTYSRDTLDRTKPVHYYFCLINDASYRDREARLSVYSFRKYATH